MFPLKKAGARVFLTPSPSAVWSAALYLGRSRLSGRAFGARGHRAPQDPTCAWKSSPVSKTSARLQSCWPWCWIVERTFGWFMKHRRRRATSEKPKSKMRRLCFTLPWIGVMPRRSDEHRKGLFKTGSKSTEGRCRIGRDVLVVVPRQAAKQKEAQSGCANRRVGPPGWPSHNRSPGEPSLQSRRPCLAGTLNDRLDRIDHIAAAQPEKKLDIVWLAEKL